MDDPVAREWPEGGPALDWDAGNATKNEKHGVSPSEIEAVVTVLPAFVGRIVEPAHSEPRRLLLGQDPRGRPLALVLTRRGDLLKPISCRPMRRNERRLYEQACQEG
ncbi:MAG: BrnT family toxin [Myxococcales bacterium]